MGDEIVDPLPGIRHHVNFPARYDIVRPANFFLGHEPWARSLEAWASSQEPWTINNRLISSWSLKMTATSMFEIVGKYGGLQILKLRLISSKSLDMGSISMQTRNEMVESFNPRNLKLWNILDFEICNVGFGKIGNMQI